MRMRIMGWFRGLPRLVRWLSCGIGVAVLALGLYLAYLVGIARLSNRGVQEYRFRSGHLSGIAFSPDGRYLYSCSWDQTIRATDLESGKTRAFTPQTPRWAHDLAVSPDGQQLAVASEDGPVWRWETRFGYALSPYSGSSDVCTHVAYSSDGTMLAANSVSRAAVRVWEARTGKLRFYLAGFTYSVTAIAFSPDSKRLAVADQRQIHLWNTASGKLHRSLPVAHVTQLAFSPDGTQLAAGGFYSPFRFFDPATGKQRSILSEKQVHRLVFLPTRGWIAAQANRLLYAGGTAERPRVLNNRPSPPPFLMRVFPVLRKLQPGTIGELAVSPDGKRLAFTTGDKLFLRDLTDL